MKTNWTHVAFAIGLGAAALYGAIYWAGKGLRWWPL